MTNAESRHRRAGSPVFQRQRHKTPETLPDQDINVSKNITSHQLGLSRPTPLMNATLKRATHTSDADYPRRQVHITSIPVHQHTCKVQESTPAFIIITIIIIIIRPRCSPFCNNNNNNNNNNNFTDNTPCGIHTNYTCNQVSQKAQTATLHYTREPAE